MHMAVVAHGTLIFWLVLCQGSLKGLSGRFSIGGCTFESYPWHKFFVLNCERVKYELVANSFIHYCYLSHLAGGGNLGCILRAVIEAMGKTD